MNGTERIDAWRTARLFERLTSVAVAVVVALLVGLAIVQWVR